MKKLLYSSVLLLFVAFSSCVSKSDYENLKIENDSIQNELNELKEVNGMMSKFASCLDSISILEDSLLNKTVDLDGKPLSKEQLLENMNKYQEVLLRQKDAISTLQDSLSTNSVFVPILSILNYTNQQITSKESMVKDLQEQVAKGKKQISTLNGFVNNLRDNVNILEENTRNQATALYMQQQQLNECYYLVADKNKLKECNLIETNIIGTNVKLQYGQFENNKEKFIKADRRDLNTIEIEGKNPKLLTQAPSSSYKVTTISNNKSTLEILDYNSFWSASGYLVILVK